MIRFLNSTVSSKMQEECEPQPRASVACLGKVGKCHPARSARKFKRIQGQRIHSYSPGNQEW